MFSNDRLKITYILLILHLQASIEQSNLLSTLSRSIKKFALLMTCHGTLDFILWSSKSPLRKILIIDSKWCGEHIFTDCIFSIILSPELKSKLSYSLAKTKICKRFRSELRYIFLFSFVQCENVKCRGTSHRRFVAPLFRANE